MAKALKIGALVVGVAALAVVTGGAAVGLGVSLGTTLVGTGISAGGLLLASTALSAGAALLQKKPSVTAAQTDRLTASIDPRTPRKTVLGSTAFPIDVRYEEWSGADQDYCDWIVCFASHAIDGLDEIWFNTELAWSAARGVEPKFRGYFTLAGLVLEGAPGNALAFGGWHGARLTGCAYARFRFKVTGNSKKAESPFSSGPPSRITAIGRGAKLYDPRRDSTVPGGSGPMRADDQSTWRFTADDGATIGDNLPLQILRVVLGWRIQNPVTGEWKLATGSGVPARRLHLGSWIEAANLADELVNRSAGGQEPRYHGAAVVSEGDDPKTTLDMLCAASCARFRDTGGRLALAIAHNDLAQAALDDGLLDDDVVGPFSWDPDPALEATPNVIRGRYVDATAAGLYQLIDYPEVRIASPDGQDRFFPLDLGAVESPSQAQRIAKQKLQRLQYQREFSATFDIRAWKYGVGDVVPFTFAPLSFTRVLFRVKEQELGQGGTCQMTLMVEHQAMYAWDADDRAPVLAAEALVYDASKNPLVLAIADAAETAEWRTGVYGFGKPSDFATNSADPASAFGPTGTVADALAAAAAREADIDALSDRITTEVDGAVQTANESIAAARTALDGRIEGARGEIAAERGRAIGAEGVLNERINSIVAEGGYDDSAVRALITTEEQARIREDVALASRVDTVQSSYSKGVTANGDFRDGLAGWNSAGWTVASNAGGTGKMLRSAVGGAVQLTPAAVAKIDLARSYRLHARFRIMGSVQSNYVGLQLFDAAGTHLGNVYTDVATTLLQPGSYTYSQLYEGVNPALVPQFFTRGGKFSSGTAFAQPLVLANYADSGGPFAAGYVELESFWLEDVGEARLVDARVTREAATLATATKAVADRTDVTEAQMRGDRDSALLGRIRSTETAVTDGRFADASRVTSVEARLDAVPGAINARVESAEQASVGRDQALAGRATAVEAQLAGTQESTLLARVRGTETALTDGRFATAQRASDIEAAAGTLKGRVDSVQTAVTDGRFAAASSVTQLRADAEGGISYVNSRADVLAGENAAQNSRMDVMVAEYNGIGATVRQQAGTIVDVNYRTRAYIRSEAVAGNNRAQLAIYADSNNGAGVDIIGDVSISGNLIVLGSVRTGTIEANAVSNLRGAFNPGSVVVEYGQSAQGVVVGMGVTSGAPVKVDVGVILASQYPPGWNGSEFNIGYVFGQLVRYANGVRTPIVTIIYNNDFYIDYPPAGQDVAYALEYFNGPPSSQGQLYASYQRLTAMEMKR